ncbi:DUF4152 family protein [Candidatus Bathyarchaeota archaeon]|nr:DUF4152 family protein [Candidatus Bathyarchaeota archaeon]
MRIIAADSSAAILDERFEPLYIVASAAVLVKPPYREPDEILAKPIFKDAKESHDVVVYEAALCKQLLERVKADVVHLDMTFGRTSIERLSPIQFSEIRISNRAKSHLLRVLPKLRKIAGEISGKYGADVLAIGKESIPVRIAELTAGAHAIIYASKKALEEQRRILLGLPSKCQPLILENRIYLYSLIAAEHDIRGFAEDSKGILKKVNISETLNPVARGFRALKIKPKNQSEET